MKRCHSRFSIIAAALTWAILFSQIAYGEYGVQRPQRKVPAAPEGTYFVRPDRPKQIIKGIGFEIQSDSIASGNQGLPDATTSVPHDLTSAERERFYGEMIKGFRYCRLAGGLYWRGIESDGKYFIGRWPEQMQELREMIQKAGVEGVSLEYWSPPPFWKANRSLVGIKGAPNALRPFGPDFDKDPQYNGNSDAFFKDLAAAFIHDIVYLNDNGIPVVKWGLQNEPRNYGGNDYSRCLYSAEQYDQTFTAIAPAIRAHDPKIKIIADSWSLDAISKVLLDPKRSGLVDELVIHHVGSDSKVIRPEVSRWRKKYGHEKPLYQNEFEYLSGPTSPARCLNTVQHIMNWFQLGGAPTWYWIHALKPVGNLEASGYSLGYWQPAVKSSSADLSNIPGVKSLKLDPGHWTWNPYNWNAVGSFIRHMPWDCQAVEVTEDVQDDDLRIFAFKRPNGKLTIVVSNRSFAEHTFKIDSGLKEATFKGYRYKPDDSGPNTMGTIIDTKSGGILSLKVDDLTWEFWEQE